MLRAYRYMAQQGNGEVMESSIFGESMEDAEMRLIDLGFDPIEVELDVRGTLNLLRQQEINPYALGTFYDTVGRRLDSGTPLDAAIDEAASFTTDSRLKMAATILTVTATEGMPLSSGLRLAGFPEADAAFMAAMRDTGQQAAVLRELGEEYQREARISRSLKGLLVEPAIYLALAYLIIWGTMIFGVPRIVHGINQIPGAEIPQMAQSVYDVGLWGSENSLIFTTLYLAVGAGFVAFVRSQVARDLLDHIPALRSLSERADHARLWRSYARMYDAAAVERSQIARSLADSAHRLDNRAAFVEMSDALEAGLSDGQAIRQAGFPDYIERAVGNALSMQDAVSVVETLKGVASNLSDDVELLAERVKVIATYLAVASMGLIVCMLIMVTVYPMMSTTLSMA